MKKRLGLLIAVLTALLCVATIAISPLSAATTYNLGQSDSDRTITVYTGDIISVLLSQNTSSTGFSWSIAQNSHPTVLANTGRVITPPSGIGASGKDNWIFTAEKAGMSELRLEYSQSWPGGSKGAQVFNLIVHVHDEYPGVPATSVLTAGLLIGGLVLVMAVSLFIKRKTTGC
jgi:predicted secreted protein